MGRPVGEGRGRRPWEEAVAGPGAGSSALTKRQRLTKRVKVQPLPNMTNQSDSAPLGSGPTLGVPPTPVGWGLSFRSTQAAGRELAHGVLGPWGWGGGDDGAWGHLSSRIPTGAR